MIAVLLFTFILIFIVGIAFTVLTVKTNRIKDDYSVAMDSEKYQTPVFVDGIEVINQDVSCGYAVIEMFSVWNGGKVTEEELYEKYGKVVTSTGKAFCDEFNRQFPEFQTTMYKYLTNSELIDKVYDCLADGVPVPFEWAAKHDDEWTLHYSLVVGMDIRNDRVVIANPYGYIETISLNEFVNRTSFNSFENMPLFYHFGFAFGIFEKNTVFIPKRVQ
ncbi:MAG: C39 family peptidase [Peptostreptococcaceae bacterium]|nr:C39 family peptidase [Peptostreptococcaceae bacterium]